MFINALIFVSVAYVSAVTYMYFKQTSLTFPASETNYDPKSTRELPNASEYSIKTPDGKTLRGIHFAAKSQNAPLIITFSGNAHDVISYSKHIYNSTKDDVNVIGLHYRSYGTEDYKSEGKPSQEIVLQDALHIHDTLKAEFNPSHIILSGYSLGSSVAAYVSSERDVDGVIMFTPFKSALSLAQDKYPFLPVKMLFKHPFPTAEFMKDHATPTAIISAGKDELIPVANLNQLKEKIANLVLDKEITAATHGDILEYKDALTHHFEAYQKFTQ